MLQCRPRCKLLPFTPDTNAFIVLALLSARSAPIQVEKEQRSIDTISPYWVDDTVSSNEDIPSIKMKAVLQLRLKGREILAKKKWPLNEGNKGVLPNPVLHFRSNNIPQKMSNSWLALRADTPGYPDNSWTLTNVHCWSTRVKVDSNIIHSQRQPQTDIWEFSYMPMETSQCSPTQFHVSPSVWKLIE